MDFCYVRLLLIFFLSAISIYSQPDTPPLTDVNRPVSIVNATDGKPFQKFDTDVVMQVGAFRNESNALALKERLLHLLNKPVKILTEDGFFKVRISGFTSQEDIENLVPSLGLIGIKNIWVFVPADKNKVIPKTVRQPDAPAGVVSEKINTPDSGIVSDPSIRRVEEKISLPDTAKERKALLEQTLSLQVESFYGKSKALRAQRRIEAKLNLPVVILNEWEYYIVIITGFKTREEISQYYPILAAMGYSKSTIIENNNRKNP